MSLTARPNPPRSPWKRPRLLGVTAGGVGGVILLAVLFRAPLATWVLGKVLAGQGIRSRVVVESIGFDGATARGWVDVGQNLDVSFDRVMVTFAPHRWLPEVERIDLQRPIVRYTPAAAPAARPAARPAVRRIVRSGPATARPVPASTGTPFVSPNLAIGISHAKVIVDTPPGPVEIDGDARLAGDRPQWINASLRPARLRGQGYAVNIDGGRLTLRPTRSGPRLRVDVSGSAAAGTIRAQAWHAALEVPVLRWEPMAGGAAVAAPQATLRLTAPAVTHDGGTPQPWSLNAQISHPRFEYEGGHLYSSGEVAAALNGALPRNEAQAVVAQIPFVGSDRRAANALISALGDFSASLPVSWQYDGTVARVRLTGPAEITGPGPVVARFVPMAGGIRLAPSEVSGAVFATLGGRHVPQITLAVPTFSWSAADGAFDSRFSVQAAFDLAVLRDASIEAQGSIRRRNGTLSVTLERCAAVRFGRYGARKPMLAGVRATLCPVDGAPLLQASAAGWSVQGTAQDVAATAEGFRIAGGSARLALDGTGTEPRGGSIDVSAVLSDPSKAPRIGTAWLSGTIRIADSVAHGDIEIAAGPHRQRIGSVAVAYGIATGSGHASVDFPHIAFAPTGLQPVQLSPMLASLAQADGAASFRGSFDWSAKRMRSGGRLDVDSLRFSSPLGAAEQLRTHMVFTSLMPIETPPDQRIEVAKVDWMLPLQKSETYVTLDGSRVLINDTKTDVAGGQVSLGPLTIDFTSKGPIAGAVRLSHVSLGTIIAASNLGSQIRLEGPISGELPFTYGPSGLHFAKGHIEADGPGKLSISPGLWGNSAPNSVEKAAYGALEDLRYATLSATLDSRPHGRLQAVFRVGGYDDSRGTRTAEFNLWDLLTGKAFQKTIPIPRGTAVNLTLDASLNFDELLRGYETAWSASQAR